MYDLNSLQNETLLGWDIHQWAVAIKRVGLGGTQMKYANKTRNEYLKRYGQNPLEFQLIGVQMEGDYDMAQALFEQLEHGLESVSDEQLLDPSYGDQTKDDKEYDEAWRIRYGRNYN
jgi:hypothetical protein